MRISNPPELPLGAYASEARASNGSDPPARDIGHKAAHVFGQMREGVDRSEAEKSLFQRRAAGRAQRSNLIGLNDRGFGSRFQIPPRSGLPPFLGRISTVALMIARRRDDSRPRHYRPDRALRYAPTPRTCADCVTHLPGLPPSRRTVAANRSSEKYPICSAPMVAF